MPSLSTARCAVFLSACRRRARTSGQRMFLSGVLWAPSVMLSPKADDRAGVGRGEDLDGLEEGPGAQGCGAGEVRVR